VPFTSAREVVAHAAAAAHGLGGLLQRRIDARLALDHLGDRVAHRLHEAVDEGRLEVDAGGGVDASGGNEAFVLRLEKAPLPVGALVLRLGLGERTRHAAADLVDARFVAFGVLFDQRLAADLLLGDERG
jgi:hypothetical protein